ncbi:hypothetical protein V8J88_08160 [Massilia sp. W12]|uniref:hypothetical protein n=1 Tax=Massilia sp. W12 TaxID=3126507 RepID=UPI0030D46D47
MRITKIIGWLMCGSALALLAVAGAQYAAQGAQQRQAAASALDPARLKLAQHAKPGQAFILADSRKLEFAVQPAPLRLVTNANVRDLQPIRQALQADPRRRWEYSLQLELLDAAGRVLESRALHMQAGLQEVKRADGSIGGAAFYLEKERFPLSAQSLNLALQAWPQVSKLRLRLSGLEPELADIALRLYQARADSLSGMEQRWRRLSAQQKEELARGSVHHQALLEEEEKQNLLRNAHQAIGPQGQPGRDYQLRNIYLLHENEGELQAAPALPPGMPFDARQYVTVPTPAQGGALRLELQANPRAPHNTDTRILWRWRGPGLYQQKQGALDWPAAHSRMQASLQLEGGLLELQIPRAGLLRVWHQAPGQSGEQEITPPHTWQRAYLAQEGRSLTFPLAESEQHSGLRLSLYSLQQGAGAAQSAHYAILDASGAELAQGGLTLSAAPEHYAAIPADLSAAQQGRYLGELQQRYLLLPPRAASVRISAGPASSILAAAHSRPYALAREVRAPDDYYSFDAKGKRIPGWFALTPQDSASLIAQDRSRSLLLQTRPAEVREDQAQILAGDYDWQEVRPQGAWLARPILAAREPGSPFRPEMLPVTFTPLAGAVRQTIIVPAWQGRQQLQASLLWLGQGGSDIRIELNGQPFYSGRLHGPMAEQVLPPISAGRHTLRVHSSNGGQFLLNHIQPGPGALVRRLAQRFQGQIVFDYQRSQAVAETLSLRVYQTPGGQADLRLRIEGPPLPVGKPLAAWLFAERVAQIKPGAGPRARILGAADELSDGGQSLYLPFPAEAPAGRYRIHISGSSQTRYLALSRLSAGRQARTDFHFQAESSHEQHAQ